MIKDLKGLVFDRLTVLEQKGLNARRRSLWLCRCSCGKEKIVESDCLIRGNTKSCGCLALEKRKQASYVKHGFTRKGQTHWLYWRWSNIKRRCLDPNNKDFARYGGRGIKICSRWLKFENFVADMENSYKEGLQIDRIDNNGDYSLANCRWTTSAENNRNK